MTNELELLSIKEASKLLTLSVSTTRRLQQERKIPFFKIGGAIRIAKSDLLKYIQARKVETSRM